MKQTRVLLADDHTLIRAGLRLVVDQQPEFTVVGEAADGRQAVALAQSLKPDIVVMDIGMPGLNGIEACRQIRDSLPDTEVVMLSMHSDEGYVLRALKAGARAYLLKDSAEADLARAIRAASERKSFSAPRWAKYCWRITCARSSVPARRIPGNCSRRGNARSCSSSPKANRARRSPTCSI